jgi:hypothetical protein
MCGNRKQVSATVNQKESKMLHRQNMIHDTRNITNRFTEHFLGIMSNPLSQFCDYIGMDIECLCRVLVEAVGLEDKTMNGGFKIVVTGDGAAITMSTTNAGQCCVSLKFIDPNAIDPEMWELVFCYKEIGDDYDVQRLKTAIHKL